MTHPTSTFATLDDWIARETLAFSLTDATSFNTAVDQVMASLGKQVELFGLGEALHGGEELLILRNRLFQYLAQAHGYSAIAIESSFSRARLVNEYVAGRSSASSEAIQESGFSHDFGKIEANRELIEWMRQYNADPTHRVKLQFYGFDSPTENAYADSPRQLLYVVLDYLASIDEKRAREYRSRIEPLLGEDSAWENPAAMMDPTKSIGLSPKARELRIETEDLSSELFARRPELVEKSDASCYLEAAQYAWEARQLLTYHAEFARQSDQRFARLVGIHDAVMAHNLAYVVARERGRGNVLAFAHNTHLTRGKADWQWVSDPFIWWPAGAHLNELLGRRYAVIGSAVGESAANGIGLPETGTLERRLMAVPGPMRLLPTHRGQGLPAEAIAALPTRTGSVKNPSYAALTPQSLTDFDWLVVVDATPYTRGGWPLDEVSAGSRQ